jgi:hypothetical protein
MDGKLDIVIVNGLRRIYGDHIKYVASCQGVKYLYWEGYGEYLNAKLILEVSENLIPGIDRFASGNSSHLLHIYERIRFRYTWKYFD